MRVGVCVRLLLFSKVDAHYYTRSISTSLCVKQYTIRTANFDLFVCKTVYNHRESSIGYHRDKYIYLPNLRRNIMNQPVTDKPARSMARMFFHSPVGASNSAYVWRKLCLYTAFCIKTKNNTNFDLKWSLTGIPKRRGICNVYNAHNMQQRKQTWYIIAALSFWYIH